MKFETVLLHRDGERIPVEVCASNARIQGRRLVVSFLFDLRDRRRAMAALNESERRFRRLVENAPDGVAVLRGVEIVFLNQRAATLLGLGRPEDGYGRRITDFIHPDDALRARERIGSLLATGAPFPEPAEYRSRAADGRELVVEISSIPVEIDGGPAVVAFARDVTERKAMQAKLAQADRLSALGVLSAGVAHEINNPLAYVLLNLEFLEREIAGLEGEDARLTGLVARIRDARHGAERVASIVRDLRTFTRGDDSLRGPVRVAAVIEAAINIAGAELQQRARIVRRYAEVPPADANANRLEQVFLNLLLNAAQAIGNGDARDNTIEIEIRSQGANVCVDIRDSGCGMTGEVMSRIFDPFFTTKPPGVGTGLGLPICRNILRALGGDVSVQSAPGRGSTFSVVLPAFDGEARPAHETSPPSCGPAGPRGRVLIVDDELAVGRTLGLVLGIEHDVTVLTSGEQALDLLRAGRDDDVDAVLCDLVMPGMSGLDLYHAIAQERPRLAERVMFMTGGIGSRRPAAGLGSIPNPLFEKPFDLDQIRSALRNMVIEHRARLGQAPVQG